MSDENPYGGTGEPPDEQKPAPSPYQGAPVPPPPGSYQAYPAGGHEPPPRSDRGRIWLGIALTIPALILAGVLGGLAAAVDDSGMLSSLIGLAGLLGPFVLLFFPSTRKIGLGLLIGYATLFILLAGVCVALIASYN